MIAMTAKNSNVPVAKPIAACTPLLSPRGAVPAVCWFMPVAKLSPISQATISITPWMPKVIINESSGSCVKCRMPSQVVQPEASESTRPVAPKQRQPPVGEDRLLDAAPNGLADACDEEPPDRR